MLRALLSLEGLWSCSAPGFPPSVPKPVVDLHEDKDGGTFKDGEGWGWMVGGAVAVCYFRDDILDDIHSFCAKLDFGTLALIVIDDVSVR